MAGTMVGFRKADFSYRWGDNYHQNFAGPRGGFMSGFGQGDFVDSHGAFGQIIKIDGSTIIMNGADNVEKVIVTNSDTVIRSLRDNIKLTDLKVNDNIVVIGQPDNNGQIEAKLIRLMPPLPPHPTPMGHLPNLPSTSSLIPSGTTPLRAL